MKYIRYWSMIPDCTSVEGFTPKLATILLYMDCIGVHMSWVFICVGQIKVCIIALCPPTCQQLWYAQSFPGQIVCMHMHVLLIEAMFCLGWSIELSVCQAMMKVVSAALWLTVWSIKNDMRGETTTMLFPTVSTYFNQHICSSTQCHLTWDWWALIQVNFDSLHETQQIKGVDTPLMSHVSPRTPFIIILAELDTYTMYCYHHYSKMQMFIEWI